MQHIFRISHCITQGQRGQAGEGGSTGSPGMPGEEDVEKKGQGPPGPPGKLGQHGQPVSIFCLLKESMYFRKGHSSHMHKGLKLHTLTHSILILQDGILAPPNHLKKCHICFAGVSAAIKVLMRDSHQKAQGKQLMC